MSNKLLWVGLTIILAASQVSFLTAFAPVVGGISMVAGSVLLLLNK